MLLRIQCCHQKRQNRKKRNQLFSQNIFYENHNFPKKVQIFGKNDIYFWILDVLPVSLTTDLPV